MLGILLTLLPIFTIMLLGALAEYKRILQKNTAAIINQFVYFFSLPILLFYIMSQVDIANISWRPPLGFTLGLICTQILGFFVARAHGKTHAQSVMAGFVSCFPNAAFMGIPVVMLVFNSNLQAEIYAGIAALLPTFNIIFTDTFLGIQSGKKQNLTNTLKHILRIMLHSPPLIGASLGLVVSISQFTLPDFINIAAKMLGSTAAPCSLFCIGMAITAQISQWSQRVSSKDEQSKQNKVLLHATLISIKLLISPLLVYTFCFLLGERGMAAMVMVIIAAMPTAIVCYVIAEKHNTFTEGCIIETIINTLFSCLTISLIISLLQ